MPLRESSLARVEKFVYTPTNLKPKLSKVGSRAAIGGRRREESASPATTASLSPSPTSLPLTSLGEERRARSPGSARTPRSAKRRNNAARSKDGRGSQTEHDTVISELEKLRKRNADLEAANSAALLRESMTPKGAATAAVTIQRLEARVQGLELELEQERHASSLMQTELEGVRRLLMAGGSRGRGRGGGDGGGGGNGSGDDELQRMRDENALLRAQLAAAGSGGDRGSSSSSSSDFGRGGTASDAASGGARRPAVGSC